MPELPPRIQQLLFKRGLMAAREDANFPGIANDMIKNIDIALKGAGYTPQGELINPVSPTTPDKSGVAPTRAGGTGFVSGPPAVKPITAPTRTPGAELVSGPFKPESGLRAPVADQPMFSGANTTSSASLFPQTSTTQPITNTSQSIAAPSRLASPSKTFSASNPTSGGSINNSMFGNYPSSIPTMGQSPGGGIMPPGGSYSPSTPPNLNFGAMNTQPQSSGAPTNQSVWDAYEEAKAKSIQDYNRIMQQYRQFDPNFAGGSGGGGAFQSFDSNYTPIQFNPINMPSFPANIENITSPAIEYITSPQYNELAGKYKNLSETGGFSGSEIAAMRARGISPVRSVYANAMRNMERQRALQGGYSPNYMAASSKMSRDLSQELADASLGVEARLAPMIREGKLAGLEGLRGIGEAEADRAAKIAESNRRMQLQADLANQAASSRAQEFGADLGMQTNLANLDASTRAQIANMEAAFKDAQLKQQSYTDYLSSGERSKALELQALDAQRALYGTTPASAALFGEQASKSIDQGMKEQEIMLNAILESIKMGGKFGDKRIPGGLPLPGGPGTSTGMPIVNQQSGSIFNQSPQQGRFRYAY
jgi:hypothetical protein